MTTATLMYARRARSVSVLLRAIASRVAGPTWLSHFRGPSSPHLGGGGPSPPLPSKDVAHMTWLRNFGEQTIRHFPGFVAGTLESLFMVVGFAVVLTIPWIVLSYVVMIGGWALGLNDLQPFPPLILLDSSCTGPNVC